MENKIVYVCVYKYNVYKYNVHVHTLKNLFVSHHCVNREKKFNNVSKCLSKLLIKEIEKEVSSKMQGKYVRKMWFCLSIKQFKISLCDLNL